MAVEPDTQPTVPAAVWKHRWLFLLIAVAVVFAGFAYTRLRPPSPLSTATASMVLQDPATVTAEEEGITSERFLNNQVAILQSPRAAERVQQLAAESEPPVALSALEFLTGLRILRSPGSNEVIIEVTANSEEKAVFGAATLIEVYEELVASQQEEAISAVIERIDAELASLEARTGEIRQEIDALQALDPVSADLERQLEETIATLIDVQNQTLTASPEELPLLTQRIRDLQFQLDLYQAVRAMRDPDPELDILRTEENFNVDRRATLLALRDQILLDAQLSPGPIVLVNPPVAAARTVLLGPDRILAVTLVLGALMGAGVAFLIEVRRRVFTSRVEPEQLLGAPLLAEIPDFSDERIRTRLPVTDSPRSITAESYRFAATSLEMRLAPRGTSVVVMISARVGAGKSTAVANTALAAAREGSRVLVVDADFGAQDVTTLLDGSHEVAGLTDVVDKDWPLERAVQHLGLVGQGAVGLLSRGRRPTPAMEVARSPRVRGLLDEARTGYSLILIDTPPFLHVAYTSSLAAAADGAVVVVEHGSRISDLAELARQLQFVSAPVIGYVYSKAPLRKEMTGTAGSLADVLGLQATAGGVSPER